MTLSSPFGFADVNEIATSYHWKLQRPIVFVMTSSQPMDDIIQLEPFGSRRSRAHCQSRHVRTEKVTEKLLSRMIFALLNKPVKKSWHVGTRRFNGR